MAKHDQSRSIPAPFYPEVFARNGSFPHAPVWSRVAKGYNQVATRMRKYVLSKSQNLIFLQGMTAANGFAWPFYFHSGEASDSLEVNMGVTAADTPGSAVPRVAVQLVRADGGPSERAFDFAPVDQGITIGGSDVARKTLRFTISPNTDYHGFFRFTNGARIVYATVHETLARHADDSAWEVHTNPTQFVRGGPIERMAQNDINRGGRGLYRHNAAHIFSWCPNYALSSSSSPGTVSQFTPVVNTNAFAPILGTGRLFFLNLIRRGRLSRPTEIPCRMAVRIRALEGPGDVQVRLAGGDGSNIGFTASVITFDPGSPPWPWYIADVVMPAVNTSWEMQADTNNEDMTFEGWSLFQLS